MTERREQRFRQVLLRRQRDLTVIFEHIDDPHNVAACLRSCDAVGVSDVFILTSKAKTQSKLSEKTSASAARWLDIHHFQNAAECVAAVRKQCKHIWAAALTDEAVSVYDIDLVQPTAVVFGNEKEGITPELLALCDGLVRIPQVGMIQSLNISVACAVILYEAFRQRWLARRYEQPPDAVWLEQTFMRWKQREERHSV
ncbi:MAG: RNA methyltransferase [Chitinophagales bacterium]|nr:RNA methyltransferase [Chitinophagales bacterium]MDW8428197.1 RNA methyltransferase [Chitinophagales bacterium]